MKKIFVTTLSLPLLTALFFIMCTKKPEEVAAPVPVENATSSSEAPLERIEIYTASIDGATHWMPKTVTVKAGKKYLLVAKHQLEGGFDFHGLQIKEFDVVAQVNRNQEFTKEINIPADKKGKFIIGCQFHPKHQSAELVVE